MDIYPCWRTIYRDKHSCSNIFRTEWGIWLQNRFTNVNGAQEIYCQLQEYVDEIWGLAEILNNRFGYRSERHQLVFHVYAQPCHQLYSILKKEVKQLLRNIAFVSEQLAIQTFSKNLEHIQILVADICTSKYKRYYLASIIARKVELKAMTPTIVPLMKNR